MPLIFFFIKQSLIYKRKLKFESLAITSTSISTSPAGLEHATDKNKRGVGETVEVFKNDI